MKKTDLNTIEKLGEIVKGTPQKVVIVIHENPDGDAIGSAIGWGEALKMLNHKVTIISPNQYPGFLKWIKTDIEIINFQQQKKQAKALIEQSDLLFCLDHNIASRAGMVEESILNYTETRVLIDHHPHPADYFDLIISEPTFASTAELVFTILEKLHLENQLTQAGAEALFTGMMTDTGSFSHNISNARTFRVASQLIEHNVNADFVHNQVYNNYSAERMQLLGHTLKEKMKVFADYRAAVIFLSKKELEEYKFESGDTEGFVNYPLSIKDIVFSTLFIEKDGFVKASFRSKGNFPANDFAKKYFNGGGHLNAAGGRIEMSLEKTVELWTQLLDEFKHLLIKTVI